MTAVVIIVALLAGVLLGLLVGYMLSVRSTADHIAAMTPEQVAALAKRVSARRGLR